MQNNFGLFLCFTSLLKYSWELEITAYSNPVIIKQHNSHKIFCQADVAYQGCTWTHVTKGSYYSYLCSVGADNIKSQNGTKCNNRRTIIWNLTSKWCGLIIQNASPSDSGEYQCELIRHNPNTYLSGLMGFLQLLRR